MSAIALSTSAIASTKIAVPAGLPRTVVASPRPAVALTSSRSKALSQRMVTRASKDEVVKGGRVGPDELTEGAEAAAKDIQNAATDLKDNIVSGLQSVGDKVQDATNTGSKPVKDAQSNPKKKAEKDVSTAGDKIGEAWENVKDNVAKVTKSE